MKNQTYGVIFNAYPDSCGGTLRDIVNFLKKEEIKEAFQCFYILPSLFHSDLDRGFSVIDYDLNEELASERELEELHKIGIELKLDIVLNHLSVNSSQFKDCVRNGDKSVYKDFFIDWNDFWKVSGEMTEEGYIRPYQKYLDKMFFRKPGLPILMIQGNDGIKRVFWNTFYQKKIYSSPEKKKIAELVTNTNCDVEKLYASIGRQLSEGKTPKEMQTDIAPDIWQKIENYMEENCQYLGQVDLNVESLKVWEYYDTVLEKLAKYGAGIVRLDAFAYVSKKVGKQNFLNEPETWEILARVNEMAQKYGIQLLPEIHASYQEKTYETISQKGYMVYDFFLPGLLLEAFENKNGEKLKKWIAELTDKKIETVHMLGCHDGIPLLDLKGLLTDEEIEELKEILLARGGYIKNLHGQKNVYYQVNATYYSALGENDRKMIMARAIQIFMPGRPQVWYLDLFAGKNDYAAVKKAGVDGHKEINRTNISKDEIEKLLQHEVTKKQLELLHFRNNFPAFSKKAGITQSGKANILNITWDYQGYRAALSADFATNTFEIYGKDPKNNTLFEMSQKE